jgi:anti-sigma B factor antagonist
MELKLARRETEGVSIIDLSGKITAGDSITAFRDAVRDEVAKGNSRILINLKMSHTWTAADLANWFWRWVP